MILSFDLGGSFVKYGVITREYHILTKSEFETRAAEGGKAIVSRIIDTALQIRRTYPLEGIAISSAGVIDPVQGIVLTATDAIPDFIGLPIKAMVESQTNLPTTVENDVNCAALAIAKLSNPPLDDFVAMTIGTGIGGAIVRDGKLIRGHSYSAGEWGKMYVAGRHYEKMASMSALMTAAIEKGLSVNNGEELFRLYDRGDLIAHSVVQRFYNFLSLGIANIIFVLNPKVVVIGGGISNRKDRFLEELHEVLRVHIPPYYYDNVEIRLAQHLNDSGILGAVVHHLEQRNM